MKNTATDLAIFNLKNSPDGRKLTGVERNIIILKINHGRHEYMLGREWGTAGESKRYPARVQEASAKLI